MAQKKNLFIGIDLNNDRAMISLFHEGMREAETISTIPGDEKYQIPTAIYSTGQGNFYYGDEALRRQDRMEGAFFSDLYGEALNKENVIGRNMLVQFIRRLLKFADRYDFRELKPYLAFAVPQVTDEAVALFQYIREELNISPEDFRLMDYTESFFAHTYHQEPSVWLHDIALFDFNKDKLTFVLLHANGTGTLKRVSSTQKEWTVPAYLLSNAVEKDEFFANVLRESFMKKIISGVYFIGDGFDGNWLKESLRVIGPNKRVFKGKNLYTRGACLAAFRNEITDGWRYYYDCPYKLQGEISLKLTKNGEPFFLQLTHLGENWFTPTEKYYLLCDGDPQLDAWIRTRERLNARIDSFTLDYVPEREPKSIRLGIQAVPISGNEVMLQIEDDGFGELFESSGKCWTFRISL